MSKMNAKRSMTSSGTVGLYLKAYNVLSALAWASVLIHNLIEPSPQLLIPVQLANSVLEVCHILLGLVRAPLGTALMQCLARLGMCLGALFNLWSVVPVLPYQAMVVVWSLADIIRYTYYLKPSLKWLRYSAFVVLYPIGLVCESLIVLKVKPFATNLVQTSFLWFGLVMYLPGFLMLYTSMWRSRARQLRQ
ncbi:very-long-chain (3R)-3-hydroxyacyl-CoA dehydratase Phs1p [Diutina catenulata]